MLDAAANAAVITPDGRRQVTADGRPQVERRRRLSQAALAVTLRQMAKAAQGGGFRPGAAPLPDEPDGSD